MRKLAKKVRKRLLVELVMLVVVAGVAGVLLLVLIARLPGMAKREIEHRLPVTAEIGSTHFSWPANVILENIILRRKSDGEQVVSVDRIEASCSLRELLAGRAKLDLLLVDGVNLSLTEEDDVLLEGGGRLPEHPVRVSALSAEIRRGEGSGARDWIKLSHVAFTLEPQASGCLAVEGSGDSAALGRFRVSGILGGELLDSRLSVSVPRVRLGPGLRTVFPESVAPAWDHLAPSGEAALTAELSWGGGPPDAMAPFGLRWRFSAEGVSVRPKELPEPITDISAVVTGTADTFSIREAAGRYRSALLTCQCDSFREGGALGVKLRGAVRNLEPDAVIVGLLPADVRSEVERLRITEGQVDAEIEMRLALPNEGPGTTDWPTDFVRVALHMRDCVAMPEWFPYRLERITGGLSLGLDALTFTTPLVGWHGGGTVRVAGTIGLSDKRGGTELAVNADDLRVDAALETALAAVDDEIGEAWKSYSFADGTIDASVTIKGSLAREGKRDWSVKLSFDGCSGAYSGFPYRLRDLTGQVDITPTKISIMGLTGWHGDSTVRIAGWADTRPEHDELNLQIRGQNVKLDEDLALALEPADRKTWDDFQPAGTADIDVVASTPTRETGGADIYVAALLKNCRARVPVGDKWLPLTDVTGRFESFGDVTRLTGVSARCLGGVATVDGTLIETQELAKLQGEVTGDNFLLSDLVTLLPDEAKTQMRLLEPSGKVRIRKLNVDVIRAEGRKPDVEYTCTADLSDVRLSIPTSDDDVTESGPGEHRLTLSGVNGSVSIESPRGQPVSGMIELSKAHVLHGTMTNVVGRFRRTGPLFALEDVRGEMYGGHVEVSCSGATDLLFFTVTARATGMDVARLCRETGLTDERVWGDLEASLQLNGERVKGEGGGLTWQLSGGGAIDIDRANLGRTPLVKSIFDYKTFLLAEESVVERARAEFEIDSTRMFVEKMILSGPSLSTRGVGWVEHGDDMALDLYFYRKGRGSLLPNLPLVDLVGKGLNWAVDHIQNELVVVHVTGTLKEPKVSSAALKDLGDRFRRYVVFNVWEEEKAEAGVSSPQ